MDLEFVFAPGVLRAKETTKEASVSEARQGFTLHSASLEDSLRTELGPQHPSHLWGHRRSAVPKHHAG